MTEAEEIRSNLVDEFIARETKGEMSYLLAKLVANQRLTGNDYARLTLCVRLAGITAHEKVQEVAELDEQFDAPAYDPKTPDAGDESEES